MTERRASILLPVLSGKSNTEEVETALADYRKFLESVRPNLPPSAYDFASASWHYDHSDHRCPHDSWVESLAIREPSGGTRQEKREVEVVIRLLGAYHDGYLELLYPGVRSYSLGGETPEEPKIGHGDWLVDEVRLSPKNLVLHEILFRGGSRWLIEACDIDCRWLPRP